MIKLNRPKKPQILIDNAAEWKSQLLSLVLQYNGYNNIPDKEKEAALKHYRHNDIKEPLSKSSFEKCAFCEGIPGETGFAEIEHFYPKSKYTDKTFEWCNLIYACRKCNSNKMNHDTLLEPIINPYETDPVNVFRYQDIMIHPAEGPHKTAAERTIKVCGLKDGRLFSARASVLVSLRNFEMDLERALDDFFDADTDLKKKHRIKKINNSIDIIEELTRPEAQLSAFCKNFLDNSDVYKKAKDTAVSFVKANT